ncbi:hypothetical protein J1N35_024997 [Gossypium stocksii]|uniref:Reverse transcriptase n=1 Tax=Gossypium stocksii TaxID=47602 RepID=A0A9D3V5L9_9ROSI|nr:hypothetical protein J1N35_024997 [Gossypium stocksii]
MTSAIEVFAAKLKEWNKCVYGHISQRKRQLTHKLAKTHGLRRNFNKNIALHNTDGDWIFDPKALKTEAIKFFQNLYGENPSPLGNIPPNGFSRLNSEEIYLLKRDIKDEEIKAALFDMAPLKAPGRSITNNVIIAQEVLHSMRAKKKLQWMAIQIDLEKASNRVRWDFMEASLNASSIPSYLVNVIMNAIFSSSMQGSIFHKRVTKDTLNFLVERVWNQLSSWDAKRLSFAGRVTLAHSVLLAILSYLIQSTLVLKGICDSIEELARQFIWGAAKGKRKIALSIGNGRTVRCWEDNWVLNVGPLNQYVPNQVNINPYSKVNEIVVDNGDWNLNLFRLWLPEEVVSRIISIPPSLDSAGPDILSWSRTKNGVFSVKSAYFFLKGDSWNPNDMN